MASIPNLKYFARLVLLFMSAINDSKDNYETLPTVTCVLNDNVAKWSESACKHNWCPALVNIPNGQVSISNRRLNSVAVYKCDRYYKLVGDSKLVCQDDRTWSGSSPVCERITCLAPGKFPNGRIIGKDSAVYNVSDVIIFRCFGGEINKTVKCLENGEWSHPPPICPEFCKEFPIIEYGQVVIEDQNPPFRVNDSLSYTCDEYFKTDEMFPKVTCILKDDVANWTKSACKPIIISCHEPDYVPNADRIGHVFNFPHSISYVCHEGFKLVGISTKYCSKTGRWQPRSLPYCERILCPAPVEIPDGDILYSNTRLNSVATYKCHRYYKLVGDSKRVCQLNGTWSGSSPVCERITCLAPEKFPNGRIIGKNTTVYNASDILIFRCFDGVTHKTSKCLENGEWSSPPPKCPVFCKELPIIENGQLVIEDQNPPFRVNDSLSYTCDVYFKTDEMFPKVTCILKDDVANWTKSACKHLIVSCRYPDSIANADRTGHVFTFPNSITYVCHEGFRIIGIAVKYCSRDGYWLPRRMPYCERIICPELVNIPNGKVSYSDRILDSVAVYSCNKYYKLALGDQKRVCEADATWSGTGPICERSYCMAPDKFTKGVIIGKRSTVYNASDVLIFRCNDGVTFSTTKCLESGEWSRPPPMCPDYK